MYFVCLFLHLICKQWVATDHCHWSCAESACSKHSWAGFLPPPPPPTLPSTSHSSQAFHTCIPEGFSVLFIIKLIIYIWYSNEKITWRIIFDYNSHIIVVSHVAACSETYHTFRSSETSHEAKQMTCLIKRTLALLGREVSKQDPTWNNLDLCQFIVPIKIQFPRAYSWECEFLCQGKASRLTRKNAMVTEGSNP